MGSTPEASATDGTESLIRQSATRVARVDHDVHPALWLIVDADCPDVQHTRHKTSNRIRRVRDTPADASSGVAAGSWHSVTARCRPGTISIDGFAEDGDKASAEVQLCARFQPCRRSRRCRDVVPAVPR